jgi:hypothetical protein
MFGKGKRKSSNDRFVMEMGRVAGNIAPPKGSRDLKGKGTLPKTGPVTRMKRGSSSPSGFREKGPSLGQVGTFKAR